MPTKVIVAICCQDAGVLEMAACFCVDLRSEALELVCDMR